MKSPLLILFAALGLSSSALSQQNADPKAGALAEAVNRFGLDLYGELPDDGANRFYSPYSVAAALSMVREGTAGETGSQIDAVFHFPAELAAHQAALREALRPRQIDEYVDGERRKVPAYQIEIANALWGQEGMDFVPAFLQTLERDHLAPLERIDFSQSAAARERINAWVEQKTHERIKDIVQPPLPTPDTRLALANAIYFKAPWSKSFRDSLTQEEPFHRLDGSAAAVPLMKKTTQYRYAESDSVQVVELPYRGFDTSMVLVVPKLRDGLPAIESALNYETLAGWMSGLKSRNVDLSLPRFEFTVPLDLNKILIAMGMPLAFSPGAADFSRMSTNPGGPLYLGAVIHKAFVAVDEKGTEAAAATIGMAFATSAPRKPEEPVVVRADHPFLFFIRDRKTGCLLFMGRVMDP